MEHLWLGMDGINTYELQKSLLRNSCLIIRKELQNISRKY